MQDPNFPALPYVSDQEYLTLSREQKLKRHTLEVREAARMFDAMQAAGLDIGEAAERVPTPRMNRRGRSSVELRAMYLQSPPAPPVQPALPAEPAPAKAQPASCDDDGVPPF
jgi:hypothetical protein